MFPRWMRLPRPHSRPLPAIFPSSLSCCTPHSASASCITFGVGGREHVSILGADSLFPALQGVKITPRWHCSGPRQCTSKSSSLVSSPPTQHSQLEGTTSREKTPSGQELCRSNLVGVGIGKLKSQLGSLVLPELAAVTVCEAVSLKPQLF